MGAKGGERRKMNGVVKGILLFGGGAVAGFAAGWFLAKRKYEAYAKDEIDSVKKYYLDKHLEHEKALKEIKKDQKELDEAIGTKFDEVVEEYKKKLGEQTVITDCGKEDEEVKAESEAPEEEPAEKPFMISEDEFLNDKNEYEKISLTYFTMDDTLADDCDEMVDIEETISTDIFNQIAESDDGDYYVRNDTLQCDYEIIKVDQSYKERYGFEY